MSMAKRRQEAKCLEITSLLLRLQPARTRVLLVCCAGLRQSAEISARCSRRLPFAAGVAAAPFGQVQFDGSNTPPTIIFSLTFLADLIAWFLLISQFTIFRSRALVVSGKYGQDSSAAIA
jgi:hypothetical protein